MKNQKNAAEKNEIENKIYQNIMSNLPSTKSTTLKEGGGKSQDSWGHPSLKSTKTMEKSKNENSVSSFSSMVKNQIQKSSEKVVV